MQFSCLAVKCVMKMCPSGGLGVCLQGVFSARLHWQRLTWSLTLCIYPLVLLFCFDNTFGSADLFWQDEGVLWKVIF